MSITGDDHPVGSGRRFDIKFVTDVEKLQDAIPDTVFHVPGSCRPSELEQLIESDDGIELDFLVEGQLLRLSLEEHLLEISAQKEDFVYGEKQLLVECIPKQAAPSPHNSLSHNDWVAAVATGYGHVLSGCYDGTVHVWTVSGTHIVTVPAHPDTPVKSVRWVGPDATSDIDSDEMSEKDKIFVTASQDETLKVWLFSPDSATPVKNLFICKGHSRSVECCDVNLDLLASGSMDCLLKVWSLTPDTDDEKSIPRDKVGPKKKKSVSGAAVSVTKSGPRLKTPIITLSGHKDAITDVVWISDKSMGAAAPEVATGSLDNTVRVWDIELREVKKTISSTKAFLSLSYSATNNALLSGSTDRHVRLWDLRTDSGSRSASSSFTSHTEWVSSVNWSPIDYNLFVSGSYDNSVKLWDIRSPNAPLYDLIGHKGRVFDVDWSTPEFVISGAADSMVKIFRT